MNVRTSVMSGMAVLLLAAGCGSDDEPVAAAESVAAEPPATPAPAGDVVTDPTEWCEQWWDQVVEADNENSAVGAAFLLAQDGVDVDDEVISSRSEVIDYRSGPSPAEAEIEQAYDDLYTACAVYTTVGD